MLLRITSQWPEQEWPFFLKAPPCFHTTLRLGNQGCLTVIARIQVGWLFFQQFDPVWVCLNMWYTQLNSSFNGNHLNSHWIWKWNNNNNNTSKLLFQVQWVYTSNIWGVPKIGIPQIIQSSWMTMTLYRKPDLGILLKNPRTPCVHSKPL